MQQKFSFVALAFTLAAFLVLCGLGAWQVQRLDWKRGVIDQLEAAYEQEAEPAVLTYDSLVVDGRDFIYGRIDGHIDFSKALLLGSRVQDKKVGASLIVPLVLDGKGVFVNLGWTDLPLDALALPDGMVEASVIGLARRPYWNSFTPVNVPEKGQWYRPDIAEMAPYVLLKQAAPFIVYADSADGFDIPNLPNNEPWWPVNNHLHYAVFWFVMALALLVIYGLRFHGALLLSREKDS